MKLAISVSLFFLVFVSSISSTYSFQTKVFDKWGSFGSGDGQFNEPADIAYVPFTKNVYVSDLNNDRIQKFDSIGNFILKWGTSGNMPGQFKHPGDIAVDSKDKFVYVADIGNDRIQKFDSNGNFVTQWGSSGNGDGQFNHPGDIAIDASNKILYVTDIGNHRIHVCGDFLYQLHIIFCWKHQ